MKKRLSHYLTRIATEVAQLPDGLPLSQRLLIITQIIVQQEDTCKTRMELSAQERKELYLLRQLVAEAMARCQQP